jgi:putative spermidine/putrescine transport system permease protein
MSTVDHRDPLVPARKRWWLYAFGVLVMSFLILPIFIVIPMSFSGSRFLDFPPKAWSLRWYLDFLSSIEWIDAAWVSGRVAVATTLLATPIGVAAAYALKVSDWPLLPRAQIVLMLPLMVPHIIIAIGIMYVYAAVKITGTLAGLIIAHTMLAIPFVVVTTLSGLHSYDLDLEKVARSLGHSRFSAFMRVTLPLIRPSVITGALFAFITSLDEVIVALFVSGGRNTTLTKVMFTSLRDELDPTIAAISSLLIMLSLSMLLFVLVIRRNR